MSALTHQPAVSQPTFPRPAAALVSKVDGSGVHVTLERVGAQLAFGPCRGATRPASTGEALTPPVGTSCLVLFADGDSQRPWIVAYEGWPV